VFRTVIPRSIRVAEAPSFGVPVVQHAPGSRGSLAYRELAEELAEREGATRVSVERSGQEDQIESKAQVEVKG
jgi:chromosome partitioning protein